MAESTKRYEVLVGMNLAPKGRRVEPGEIVTDVPASEVKGLLEQGAIREASSGAKSTDEPKEGE